MWSKLVALWGRSRFVQFATVIVVVGVLALQLVPSSNTPISAAPNGAGAGIGGGGGPAGVGSGAAAGPGAPRPAAGRVGDLLGVWGCRETRSGYTITIEFRPDGTYVNRHDRRQLHQEYTYGNNVLTIYYVNPRTDSRDLMERGSAAWTDGDTFVYAVSENTDSIHRRGWTYEYRRQ